MRISIIHINRLVVSIYCILLATVLDAATWQNKNFLLIGFSIAGMLMMVVLNYRNLPFNIYPLPILLLVFMLISGALNYSDSQASSLTYSAFFVISYIFYTSVAQRDLEMKSYKRVLKIIFFLYLAGLIAGLVYVVGGYFTPEGGIIGFLKGRFGTTLEADGFRYYSLSSEPSYASFIVILLFVFYMSLDQYKGSLYKLENLVMFILLAFMILFFRSGYGVLLFGVLIVRYMGFSRISITIYAIGFVIVMLILFFGKSLQLSSDFVPLQRVINVINKLDITNPSSLYTADFNTYFRITPIFYYFETASIFDWQFYLGHGASSSKQFIVPEIYTAYLEGEYLGGFLPAFLYDYGIVGAGLVLIFIFRQLTTLFSMSTLIVILLLTNANLNTQLFWFTLFCITMNSHYQSTLTDRNEVTG